MHRPGRPAFNVELPDLPPRSLSESQAYQNGQSDPEASTDSSVYSLVLSSYSDDTSVVGGGGVFSGDEVTQRSYRQWQVRLAAAWSELREGLKLMAAEGIALPTGQVCCEQVCGELAAMRRLDCGAQHFLCQPCAEKLYSRSCVFHRLSAVGCTSRLCTGFSAVFG